MKKQFTEQCVDSVLDRVCPVSKVASEFRVSLEERIKKSAVSGDFDHNLVFTLNYPGHPPRKIEDTLTLSSSHHVGEDYLAEIREILEENVVIDRNFNLTSYKESGKERYDGIVNFNYKAKQ